MLIISAFPANIMFQCSSSPSQSWWSWLSALNIFLPNNHILPWGSVLLLFLKLSIQIPYLLTLCAFSYINNLNLPWSRIGEKVLQRHLVGFFDLVQSMSGWSQKTKTVPWFSQFSALVAIARLCLCFYGCRLGGCWASCISEQTWYGT